MPETPDRDPVLAQSLSTYLLIAALALMASLGWALYDEFYGLRPWKQYQSDFQARYATFLKKQVPLQRRKEEALEHSADYEGLKAKLAALRKTTDPQVQQIDEQSDRVEDRINTVLNVLTTARAYVGSRTYDLEHASSPGDKRSIEEDVTAYKKGPFVIDLPPASAGAHDEVLRVDFDRLEVEFNLLQQEKGKLLLQKAGILKPVSTLQNQIDNYVKDHIDGLTVEALEGLEKKNADAEIEIKQINNPDLGIVDRCESCHVGTREPVMMTAHDMGGDAEAHAFTSHPDPELLKIHDPEVFGCTPCHNGNGMEIAEADKAHGHDEHWLWPLFPKANVEAGCQQCHAQDMVVDHAAVLTEGKDLFQWRGCVGCHRYEGYDSEPEDLVSTERTLGQLAQQRAEDLLDVQKAIHAGDNAPDNETARRFYAQADDLRLDISKSDMQTDQLETRTKYLMMDRKKVGPDLKEIRAKLRPEWIPVWLKNPHAFRPTTRMPRFRLDEDELPAVAAFIWQDALDVKAPSQPPGDPAKGKIGFETRGCMACHAVGEGDRAVGGWFGANLSRVGEKVNYDYLVRWIHNPRERSAPYCPLEHRDLTPQDYAKHGLPYVFDTEHSKCPNDGAELQVEQMTPMPSLRLSWQESRDIASYLMTLKEKDPGSYAPAPFLNDPKLKAEGELIVRRYGCAGCHEIAGFEDEGRIGTELTVEGSKPLEQMDFALYVRQAKEEGWWNHKGFFEHKLARPEMYDDGMVKAEGEELKMPDFFEPVSGKAREAMPELASKDRVQIQELTTFLMGSVQSEYPERYFYMPDGMPKDVQEGWWVVKKYNCMGCHQFTLDQPSVLMTLPQYQTPDTRSQLPPRLVTEGARVDPDWLARFLTNPSLSDTDTDRDGVRSYLKARMPTFYLSPIEVRKLVRFFQALSAQPMPYIPRKLEPLTTQETAMARALFTSKGAPCLKCHAIGVPSHDQYATAPNFLLAGERLKPDWVTHWILDPSMIDPGTAMPSGLFKQEDGHWVFNGPTPPIFQGYTGDEANLLMRYLFEITPAEQQRLIQMTGSGLSAAPAKTTSQNRQRGTLAGVRAALVGRPAPSRAFEPMAKFH